MKTVKFTEMKNGSKDDYQLLEKLEKKFERQTADRILRYLSKQTSTLAVSYTHLTLPTR